MALDERAVKFHTLGNTLVAEQKFNEAIQNYLKAVDIAPHYDAAVYHLAEAYEAKQLDDEALKYYTRAIELNPSYATIHIKAGLDSLLSGPLGKAVAAFKKDLKDHAGDPAVSGGAQATRMDQQSSGEYDGPIAQKGLTPRKLIVEEADKDLRSVINTHDTITARVLGDRDVPVLECPVTFELAPPDERLMDGALAKSIDLLKKAPQKKLTMKTDENGFATVHFQRSKFTGKNVVKVTAAALPQVLVEDDTRGATITDAEITPSDSAFSAGESVSFSALLKDKFGNHVAGREVQFTLTERENHAWNIIDAITVTSDASGAATHTFHLPTHSGIECRLQVIDKDAKFTRRHDFKLISSAVGSALFIPMLGKIAAGKPFALKVKLLDEYDNPVIGRRASIIVKDASGGDWSVASEGAEATGKDGSILCNVVPPAQIGATAVFTVQARGLEPGAYTASFETVPGDAADRMASNQPAAPVKKTEKTDPGGVIMPETSGNGVTSGFLDSILPRPSDEPQKSPMPLKGPGLQDLDFDVPEPDFAITGSVHPEAPEPAAGSALQALDGLLDSGESADAYSGGIPLDYEPTAAPDPAMGSAFDALGDMLDSEELHSGGDIPQPGASQEFDSHESESFDQDAGLLLPDDVGEPALNGPGNAYGFDEPAGADIPLPDDEPAEPAPSPMSAPRAGVAEIRLEKNEYTCRVGDTIHLSFTAFDASGNPLSSDVNAVFRIVEEPLDSDACFLLEQDNPGDKVFKVSSDGSQFLNATLQAPTVIGAMTVEAGAGPFVETISVQVLAGDADRIELSAAESAVAPDQMTVVSAHVYDRYDNPLGGETVTFTVYDTKGQGGWLEEPVTVSTDGSGEAQATFVGGGNPGDLTIVTASHDLVISQSVQKVTIETIEAAEDADAPVAESGYAYEEQMPPLDFESAAVGGPGIAPPMAPAGPAAYQPPQAAAPPLPPMPQQPPPLSAPQAPSYQQPGVAPLAPTQYTGGVEYMPDDLSAPAANGPYEDIYPHAQDAPVYEDGELAPEDYYEIEDPYAVPKFEVSKGRKPAFELSELLPKIMKVMVGLLLVVAIVWIGFKSASGIMYQMNFNRANKLYNQQQGDKALIYYEKCTKIRPRQIEPYTRMSEIYMSSAAAATSQTKKDRMLINAAKQLNAAINFNPDNIDALYNLCRVFKMQENYNQCAKFCGQALLVDPKFEAAQSDQQECLDNAGY